MKKKSLIQISLLILLFFISFFFLKNFYEPNISQNETKRKTGNTNLQNESKIKDEEKQNLIKDIKYNSNYSGGKNFEILADFGETSYEDPDLMFLTNVKGKIILNDKENIFLTSNYADFNTRTFETTFIESVKVLRKDEIITGNSLYLVFELDENELKDDPKKEQNLIRMSQNVEFKKPGHNLKADIIEIDLITKNSKIYMYNEKQKVIIESKVK